VYDGEYFVITLCPKIAVVKYFSPAFGLDFAVPSGQDKSFSRTEKREWFAGSRLLLEGHTLTRSTQWIALCRRPALNFH